MLEDEAEPLGPLDAADPPLGPPLLLAADPPVPPLDIAPLPVPPVAPELVSLLELAEELGVLGVVVDDDEDDPPGTTTVSLLVEDEADPLGVALPPGTTVVVSFRSHAENANALTKITM